MSATNSDRNLLLGLLALQNGFVSREQLVAGFSTWLLDKRQALDSILRDQGALDRDTQELLSALTSRHLAMHGDDAQRSLAAVSSVASARDDLQHLADPELNASLGHVPLWQRADDPFATRIVSVGAASAAGQRFRILRPHAKGGLGLVSVALDGELNREVALKEIQAQLADDAESRARFLREAELTGGLEHPGIVPVYGMGTYDDGRPFYAMRFIRGDSLKAALEVFHQTDWSQRGEGERALHLRNLLGRFVDVCNAVAYAHSRGVLHRDLKPGNIMLGNYGETLVVDWGLAKAQNPFDASDAAEIPLRPSGSDLNQTLPGKAVGTPGYMSPEQAAGRMHDLGPKTDVYSLGATLYHVLTGRSAFNGLDVGEVLQRIQRGDFLPPRRLDATIPRALDAICLKAMALSAADRYVSPKELADDVERWLADEPVSAYAEPLGGRISRVARRHKGVVRASAIALAAVAVISTLAAIRENSLNTALTETIAQRDEALKAAATATGEALSSVAFLQDLFTTTDPLGMDAVDLDGRYYLSGSNLTPLQLVNEGDQRLKSLQLSPQSRAVLLETIGNAFRGLGQYDRADPLLTESLQLRTEVLPAESHDLALCRFNLANLRQDQGRFGEAEALYRTAIAVLETQPADLKTLASMQFSLAWTLSQRYGAGRDERFAEAIAIMQRVIETRAQIYTRRSKEVAMTLATLSLIYRVAGRGAEEIAALGQATEIMKELGGDVVATIFVDYTTAQGLRKLRLRDQSLAYYERAYDATVNLAGKEHPAAIFLLADLAGFHNEMGENETALRLATEAVEILDRSPLRWSPLAVEGMLDYARWLQESGDTLRVREVLQQALLIAHTIEHAPLIDKCNQRINELPEPLRL